MSHSLFQLRNIFSLGSSSLLPWLLHLHFLKVRNQYVAELSLLLKCELDSITKGLSLLDIGSEKLLS